MTHQLTYIFPNIFKIAFCISLRVSFCFLESLIASNLVYWRHQPGAAYWIALARCSVVLHSQRFWRNSVLANYLRIFHVSPQNNKLQVCNFYDNSKPTNAITQCSIFEEVFCTCTKNGRHQIYSDETHLETVIWLAVSVDSSPNLIGVTYKPTRAYQRRRLRVIFFKKITQKLRFV